MKNGLRPNTLKQTSKPGSDTAKVLEGLKPEEALTVLRQLLDEHPELRPEAERFAVEELCSSCIEDIAEDVCHRVTRIDLDNLNQRAGAHSWGYVEPSEAAIELLEECLEDLTEDMKRKVEVGCLAAGETICAGIVAGLYQCREKRSDGALGWAPDFPAEHAFFAVEEFLGSVPKAERKAAEESLMEVVRELAPEWDEDLKRALKSAI
ncbi:MAG: hypothetical protein C5B50_21025 [Verrucomicrobia bacterium]|nr:MAG: hypothetical protein C5B50_21025 [Verrucomicrobiota bacterium]